MKLINRLMRRDAGYSLPDNVKSALGSVQHREVSIRQNDIDDDERTVEIAVSSDTPIYRNMWGWKFNEILSHEDGAVRMERFNDGAAVLMDHNSCDQIGVIQDARLEDGKLRATVRFSKSARATEIFQDVQDGIRTKISVGYAIHAYEEKDGGSDGVDEIRITDWEPMEASFVSIPADNSVGVGREEFFNQTEQQENHPMFKKTAPAPEAREHEDVAAESEGGLVVEESTREEPNREQINAEIKALGERFNESQMARDLIELDGSVEDMKKALREKRSNAYPVRQSNSQPYVEMRMPYQGKLRGFSDEESAYRAGKWIRSWMFEDRAAHQWCKDHGMRVATEGKLSKGGAVVPHEMSSAIIDLREQYGVMRGLLRVINMSSDQLTIPRRTGGLTAYAVGEETEITASDKAWDQITLAPKKWGVLSKFSTDYAEDAVIDVAMDLADEAAYAFAQKEDECAIDGDGTSTYHGIYGFRAKLNATALAGRLDATAGDDQFSELIASDLDLVRGTLPEYAVRRGRVVWLCSKYAKNVTFDGITRAAGGNTQVNIGGSPADAYLGDEIVVSQAMPSASTAYNELVMLLYGNFSLAATIGDRRSFTFKVLDERYAEYDQIGILATTRFDINVHDLGDTTNAGPVVGLRGNTS